MEKFDISSFLSFDFQITKLENWAILYVIHHRYFTFSLWKSKITISSSHIQILRWFFFWWPDKMPSEWPHPGPFINIDKMHFLLDDRRVDVIKEEKKKKKKREVVYVECNDPFGENVRTIEALPHYIFGSRELIFMKKGRCERQGREKYDGQVMAG